MAGAQRLRAVMATYHREGEVAEIHVQRKERKLWPWALGIAALLLLLFVIVDRDDGAEYAAGEVASDVGPTWIESQRFIGYARDSQPNFGDMNAAHEYTRNGLRYLASALDEIRRQDRTTAPNIEPRIAALREGAETLRAGAAAPGHADAVATVFNQAVSAITDLQRARFPGAGDEVEGMREAANRVSPERPLLEQRDAVKGFFDHAVSAVRAMGAPEPQTTARTGGSR